MDRGPLLILGASGRAAAVSAIRAGYLPFVIDLFADEDTRSLCPVLTCPVAEYPHGMISLSEQAPTGPWMYTGGIENHPNVVEAISVHRELFGVPPSVLNCVRDPFFLETIVCKQTHFAKSVLTPDLQAIRNVKKYLHKPRRSAGGLNIRFANHDDMSHPDFYYQEYAEGDSKSALFFADSQGVVTFGISRQLIGISWLHASEFQYAGSLSLPNVENPIQSWAEELCRQTGLRGIFGIDFVCQNSERNIVVEVNPRYVASLEIHELATKTSLLNRREPPPAANRTYGKAVYYAPYSILVPPAGPWDHSLAYCRDVWQRPDFADIPSPGSRIEKGQPVITILAEGKSELSVLANLKKRSAELDHFFANIMEHQK